MVTLWLMPPRFPGRGAALAAAHDDINSSLRQADALNLDRRQTVTDALMRLEEAFRAS